MKWTESFERINLVSMLFCSNTLQTQESVQQRPESSLDVFMRRSSEHRENVNALNAYLSAFACAHPGRYYL